MTESSKGIIEVDYLTADQLLPENITELIAAMARAGQQGPQVVLHHVGPAVRTVPIRVPTYWLEVIGRAELRLVGLGVITASRAVRAAANAFGAAARLARSPLHVQAFSTGAQARDWAAGLLVRAPASCPSE